MKLKPIQAAGLTLLLAARAAHAGASLYIDDAGSTPAGRCQVESWVRSYAPGQEWTTVPACTRGGLEYSLGVSRYTRSRETLLTPGIKRTLLDPDEQAWGAALAVGAVWDVTRGRLDGWTATAPVTLALDTQGRTVLNADLGWSKLRGKRGAPAGGLGLARRLDGRWSLLAEAYADGVGNAVRQAGLRQSFGAGASLDLLLGRADGSLPGRWFTLGFNVVLP